MPKAAQKKIVQPTSGSTQATRKGFRNTFKRPIPPSIPTPSDLQSPLREDPDVMETRIKDHVDDAVNKLYNHLYALEDVFETGKRSEKRDIRAVGRQCKEGQEEINERLDDMTKGMEKQLELVQGLGPMMAETTEKTRVGKKRLASDAFGTNDDDDLRTRTCAHLPQASNHASSFEQLERRLGMHFSNTQTHVESAVYEMKSGTFKRLADLDERMGVIEAKMDWMARFMARLEVVSSANTGPSGFGTV